MSWQFYGLQGGNEVVVLGDFAPKLAAFWVDEGKVGRCKVEHIETHVKSAWMQHIKLIHNKLLSSFAFNIKLSRYGAVLGIMLESGSPEEEAAVKAAAVAQPKVDVAALKVRPHTTLLVYRHKLTAAHPWPSSWLGLA